jgi:hypothetical protein
LDYRTDEAAALIHNGWMVSQEPVTKGLGSGPRSPEIDLRDAGKWETVRRRRVRLRPGEFDTPRVELSYIARRDGQLVHESASVPFAFWRRSGTCQARANSMNWSRISFRFCDRLRRSGRGCGRDEADPREPSSQPFRSGPTSEPVYST